MQTATDGFFNMQNSINYDSPLGVSFPGQKVNIIRLSSCSDTPKLETAIEEKGGIIRNGSVVSADIFVIVPAEKNGRIYETEYQNFMKMLSRAEKDRSSFMIFRDIDLYILFHMEQKLSVLTKRRYAAERTKGNPLFVASKSNAMKNAAAKGCTRAKNDGAAVENAGEPKKIPDGSEDLTVKQWREYFDISSDSGKWAFGGLRMNANAVHLPGTIDGKPLYRIKKDAFSVGNACVSVVFPNTIERVDSGAIVFSSLKTIEFLADSIEFGENAIANNEELETVIFHGELKMKKYPVFYQCPNLKKIIFCGVKAPSVFFKKNCTKAVIEEK